MVKRNGDWHIGNLSLLRHTLNDFRPIIQNQSDAVYYQKVHTSAIGPVQVPPIEDHSDLEIKYHLILMDEARLLRCEHVRSSSEPARVIRVLPFSRTWQGHEFLDASRNEALWKRAAAKLRETGLSATIGVLQSLLVAYAKQQLGI